MPLLLLAETFLLRMLSMQVPSTKCLVLRGSDRQPQLLVCPACRLDWLTTALPPQRHLQRQ